MTAAGGSASLPEEPGCSSGSISSPCSRIGAVPRHVPHPAHPGGQAAGVPVPASTWDTLSSPAAVLSIAPKCESCMGQLS